MHNDIVICAARRTPIGAFGGALKDTPATALGASAIAAAITRSGLHEGVIDAVIMGNVIQAGNGMNPGRQASIGAGLPVDVPAMTVNRVCGSGAQAVASAFADIHAGLSRCVVAGGMENMDAAPYVLPAMRHGSRLGDTQCRDTMQLDGLNDAFSKQPSGWHTEDLVNRYGITREQQDAYAVRSQQRFARAQAEGVFDDQLVPVEVVTRKSTLMVATDEAGRPDTTLGALGKLKPAFRPDGTITAGNSPGVNAGAAAMIVCSRETADELGMIPMLTIRSIGLAAVEPGMFGMAPIPAIRTALARAKWNIAEVDRFEVNEAFAAIALAVQSQLGIDEARFNMDGGAIAHGHPIGATGAILITKVAHAMARNNEQKAIVSMCIGGGQGIALCLERPF